MSIIEYAAYLINNAPSMGLTRKFRSYQVAYSWVHNNTNEAIKIMSKYSAFKNFGFYFDVDFSKLPHKTSPSGEPKRVSILKNRFLAQNFDPKTSKMTKFLSRTNIFERTVQTRRYSQRRFIGNAGTDVRGLRPND